MTSRIRDAQDRLGRTLRRARLVEDRAMARTVRELGERLANINYGLLRLVSLHSLDNQALDRPVDEFCAVLGQLVDLLGPVTLVCVEDQVHVNDVRIRFETNPEHAAALTSMLQRHNVGGVTYFGPLTADQVRSVLGLFAGQPAADRPRAALQEKLNDSGLASIEVHGGFRFRADEEPSELGVAEVLTSSAAVIADCFVNMATGRLPNPLPVRRVVNDLLDATDGRDLARISFEMDAGAPAYARHTLTVTCLSALIGRAAGLSEPSLADLGVAAMLHDIGFCLHRPGGPADFADHIRAGVRILLRQRGYHEARVRRLLTVLEHHDPFERPGRPPELHSRILHIADDYDILTRHRAGRGPVQAPADALRLMAAHSGGAYDPTLLQLFINAVGAYPPGSVLQLGDGTLVVVISGVRSPETFATPRCKVVRMADGSQPQQDLWVDLAKGGRIIEVLGSRLVAQPIEEVPEPEPAAPPKPAPPPRAPTFGSPHLRPPKPARKK